MDNVTLIMWPVFGGKIQICIEVANLLFNLTNYVWNFRYESNFDGQFKHIDKTAGG